MTAIDLTQKILEIQKIFDSIEVKGYSNVSAVFHGYELCSEILRDMHKVLLDLQNESKEGGTDIG